MALASGGGGRRVLISGASIAGPAVAFWLNRYGFQTTIVERAPELRMGGQNIDIQGAGQAVALLMDGLESDIRASTTGEVREKLLWLFVGGPFYYLFWSLICFCFRKDIHAARRKASLLSVEPNE